MCIRDRPCLWLYAISFCLKSFDLASGVCEICLLYTSILYGNLENPQRVEQVLVETENEIFGYDGIFGITETEWEVQEEREISATKQEALVPVSYTHLDVYKRQNQER